MEKWPFFQVFLLGNIDQINVSYDILELKERLSRLKKQQDQNVEKLEIFPDGLTHSFSSKNSHFSNLFFFLGNIGQENVFYDILERKNAFLGYKNKKFKKSIIDIFPKGLTHGFGPKMTILAPFFLGNIGKENVF